MCLHVLLVCGPVTAKHPKECQWLLSSKRALQLGVCIEQELLAQKSLHMLLMLYTSPCWPKAHPCMSLTYALTPAAWPPQVKADLKPALLVTVEGEFAQQQQRHDWVATRVSR